MQPLREALRQRDDILLLRLSERLAHRHGVTSLQRLAAQALVADQTLAHWRLLLQRELGLVVVTPLPAATADDRPPSTAATGEPHEKPLAVAPGDPEDATPPSPASPAMAGLPEDRIAMQPDQAMTADQTCPELASAFGPTEQDPVTVTSNPLVAMGAELRRLRLEQGLSLADMSCRSLLSAEQLIAIEAGNRGALQESVYLLGQLRKAARVLGLAQEPWIGQVKRYLQNPQAHSEPLPGETRSSETDPDAGLHLDPAVQVPTGVPDQPCATVDSPSHPSGDRGGVLPPQLFRGRVSQVGGSTQSLQDAAASHADPHGALECSPGGAVTEHLGPDTPATVRNPREATGNGSCSDGSSEEMAELDRKDHTWGGGLDSTTFRLKARAQSSLRAVWRLFRLRRRCRPADRPTSEGTVTTAESCPTTTTGTSGQDPCKASSVLQQQTCSLPGGMSHDQPSPISEAVRTPSSITHAHVSVPPRPWQLSPRPDNLPNPKVMEMRAWLPGRELDHEDREAC